jgi:hypothetical protein
MQDQHAYEEEHQPQTQSEMDGSGRPPRRTALGTQEPDPAPKSLNWWQRIMAKLASFLLGADTSPHDRDE